ncbi:MAG: HD domain-containing protein [Nitrospirae bacterium]|nr:HD domain-containing protein [Nitrospirota bacterium]MBF0541739.1 HD domain-containing protein [Nitrospirota bacterium]
MINEMDQIKLKKIISKKKISNILTGIIESISDNIGILDADGKLLLGSSDGSKKHSIDIEGKTIGYVTGGDKAIKVLDLLIYIADTALDSHTLANEALDKYKEISLLYEMSEKISSSLDSSKVSQLIIDEIKVLVKADNVSIFRMNEEIKELELIAVTGSEYSLSTKIKSGEGIIGSVFLSKKSEIVNDTAKDNRYITGSSKVASIMCVPMMLKQRASGVIKVSTFKHTEYSAEDLKLLVILASHAAVAVENAWLYDRLAETFFSTINTLAETIERRSPASGGHSQRVSKASLSIGRAFGLSMKEMSDLRLASVLHDIGKIGIPDSILLKSTELTAEEMGIMDKHSINGADILKNIKQLKDVVPCVRAHHERYDGTGIPDKLKGDKIPIAARVLAVANAYDNYVNGHYGHASMSSDDAAEKIRKLSGTEFDPDVVRAFYKIYKDGKLL